MAPDNAEIGFRERLAYLRHLRNRGRLRHETDGQTAEGLGVDAGWIDKWKRRHDPPPGHRERNAMEPALEAMGTSTAWLYESEGNPPDVMEWKKWYAEWRRAAASATLDQTAQDEERPAATLLRKMPAKQASIRGKGRGRD